MSLYWKNNDAERPAGQGMLTWPPTNVMKQGAAAVRQAKKPTMKRKPCHPTPRHLCLALTLCVAVTGPALAQSCSGGGGDVAIPLPSTVIVPREAAVGDMLTNWTFDPNHRYVFTCDGPFDREYANGATFKYVGASALDTVVVAPPTPRRSGATARVVATNVPGIGLAVSGIGFGTGATSTSFWSNPEGSPWPVISHGGSKSNSGTLAGGMAAFALVRIAGEVTSGSVVIPGTVMQMGAKDWGGTWRPVNYGITNVEVKPLTCQVTDVPVPMGVVASSEFKGIGSRSKPVAFSIDVKNCPVDVKTIDYQLDPLTPVLDAGNAVIGLAAGGATGVGLQIADAAGSPVKYKTPTRVTAYVPGGDASIDMQAAYYQTEAAVGPGAADAAVEFTMSYK